MPSRILLEQDQKDLLVVLVEASRNVPRNQREQFTSYTFLGDGQAATYISHAGLPDGSVPAYEGDLKILARKGLLDGETYKDAYNFDVTPEGFAYYEEFKRQAGQPLERIEDNARRYFDADRFRQAYGTAYQKWVEAERLLWDSDSQRQLTTIGHLCREAMQEFATILVDRHQPANVTANKASDVARIRAVLDHPKFGLGDTLKPFLFALLAYWGTVSDLVQRQEHGAQREGLPLVWEDARRVVFQTIVVMFEIDRALAYAATTER